MSYFNMLFFGIYPYIAILVFLVGCWIRFDREPYTWKASSRRIFHQACRKPVRRLSSGSF
ncbi:MAG: respiratory nitrate reductase subunit gamma [bacterium]|nr:respiratory nitrate reductase subunit gamma [bacterium]